MTNVQQGRNVADRKYGHKVRCEREAGIDDAPGTTYMSVDSNAILK